MKQQKTTITYGSCAINDHDHNNKDGSTAELVSAGSMQSQQKHELTYSSCTIDDDDNNSSTAELVSASSMQSQQKDNEPTDPWGQLQTPSLGATEAGILSGAKIASPVGQSHQKQDHTPNEPDGSPAEKVDATTLLSEPSVARMS